MKRQRERASEQMRKRGEICATANPKNLKPHFVSFSECPRSNDRMERFACPTPDFRGRYRCIDDRSLCDGFFDCPGREDESQEHCMFYKTVRERGSSFLLRQNRAARLAFNLPKARAFRHFLSPPLPLLLLSLARLFPRGGEREREKARRGGRQKSPLF